MAEQDRQLAALDGVREVIDGRDVLRFERRIGHPVERVWEALTSPDQISQWLEAQEVHIELVAGGRFDTRTTGPPELVEAIIREAGEAALQSNDTVLRVEPPHILEHTFGGNPASVVRWELLPDGGGCLLRLMHTEPTDFQDENAPRDLAGWHVLLEQLEKLLEGTPAGFSMERWEGYKEGYAAKLEIG
jgi:uncharacterized protein YndB with AHSA1/START domain